MKSGALIAFEGVDGCGKSTQLRRLAAALTAEGHDVVVTHEPTDGPTGRRIREMARSGERIPPSEELRWFTEDRADHVRDAIAPALAEGKLVLTDRYTLSSVAYQGARGLDPDAILADSERYFPIPDLVLLFVLDPARALARLEARGGITEPTFERLDLQQRVAENFARLTAPYIERIDAGGDEDEVYARVRAALKARLGF